MTTTKSWWRSLFPATTRTPITRPAPRPRPGRRLRVEELEDRTTPSTITRVSTTAAGVQGNGYSQNALISANGRFIVFNGDASNLVSGDTGYRDVFVKDLQTGGVVRASTTADGGQPNGDSLAN